MQNFKKTIDIIIPCHNEEQNIPSLVDEIVRCTANMKYEFHMLFIDDGSVDDTYQIIAALRNHRKDIKIIRLSKNFGKESAIAAGLYFSDADAVIVIDADLQHPPHLIPFLTEAWEKGAHIVDTVKRVKLNNNRLRNIAASAFYKILNMLSDLDITGESDYKLLDRKVINVLNGIKEKNRFFRGLTNWIGFNHCQIEFNVKSRTSGDSKFTWVKLFRLSLDAVTSHSSKPLHLVTILGTCTFIFSIIFGLQTLYNFFSGHAVSGFTTVIVLILLLSSVIMISIGIIGLYIAKLFHEVKNRPIFIVAQKDT